MKKEYGRIRGYDENNLSLTHSNHNGFSCDSGRRGGVGIYRLKSFRRPTSL